MRAKEKNLQRRKRRLRVPQKPLFEWREEEGETKETKKGNREIAIEINASRLI